MTDDTPPLRDEVLSVLAGAEAPIGLAAIAAAINQTSKEDLVTLAGTAPAEGPGRRYRDPRPRQPAAIPLRRNRGHAEPDADSGSALAT